MRAQVVVIGGGEFGASCLYHLATRGVRDVVLLEQATLGSGSTGRSAAVVETQYLAADQVALCAWSMRVSAGSSRSTPFRSSTTATSDSGTPRTSSRSFHASVAMQRGHGLTRPRGCSSPAEAARIVPALRVDDLAGALWGPSDGYVDAVRYCELLTGLARAAGARVLQGTRATGLRLRGDRVTAVEVDGETIDCETVVNASGAWARRIGSAVGLTLPVDGYRRQLVQFEPPQPLAAPVPMVIDYVPGVEAEGLYFRDDTSSAARGGSPLGGARGLGAPGGSGRVPSGRRLGLRRAGGRSTDRPLPGCRGVPRDRRLGRALPAHPRHAADRGTDAGSDGTVPSSRGRRRRSPDLSRDRRHDGGPGRDGRDRGRAGLGAIPARPLHAIRPIGPTSRQGCAIGLSWPPRRGCRRGRRGP